MSAAGARPVIVPPSPEPDGFIVSVVTAPLSLRARVAPERRTVARLSRAG